MAPARPATVVLSKLGRVKRSGNGWSASCPVEANHSHGDRNPSLSVAEGADGTVLLTCHTGCSFEDICASLQVEPTDLFPPEAKDPDGRVVIADYHYTDELGNLLYVKERLYPKSFRQKRPVKGGWEWKLGRTRRPLYRLPKVLEAKAAGKRIWFVEGERDVHTLEFRGEVATTAGGVKDFRPEHAETLQGCDLVVIADNDSEGRKLATQVAEATGAAVLVSDRAKDITEHFAKGGTLDDLTPADRPGLVVMEGGKTEPPELVDGVRDGDCIVGEAHVAGIDGMVCFEAHSPRNERTGIHTEMRVLVGGQMLAYSIINVSRHEDRTKLANLAADNYGDKTFGKPIRIRLDAFCARLWDMWTQGDAPVVVSGKDVPAAEYLLAPYLTRSKTILFAPGGSAKSWLALVWALTIHHGLSSPWTASKRCDVLYVDFEDEQQAMESRLHQLGGVLGCPAQIPAYFAEGKGLKDVWDGLRRYTDAHSPGLLVVDSISRLGLGKLVEDESANRAVDMLNRLGVPWLALAHTPKANGEHVFGSAMYEYGARVVIKGEASHNPEDEGLIGLRLSITKANHLRLGQTQTWAFRFTDDRLSEHRQAHAGDFPDLGPAGQSVSGQVRSYLDECGKASASEIADELGLDRSRVAHVLAEGRSFTRVGKEGRRVLWGIVPWVAEG